jgi:putative redox protein
MTLRVYAKRKGWPVGAIHVEVTHDRTAGETPPDRFTRAITLGGDLDAEQRQRLMQIADMCPVHRMLTAGVRIETQEAVAT